MPAIKLLPLKSALLALSLIGGLAAPALAESQPSAAQAAAALQSPVRLRLLSFNVWGLPAPIGQNLDQRMERIAESLMDFDIVVLQETFDHRTEVLPKLSGFPYAYHHKNGSPFSQACGLMVLSRYEIVETDFMPFPDAVMPDALASKGVLFARVKHPELGFVDIYDTHYQSRDEADAVDVRIRYDNATLQRLLLKHNQYYPTVFGGDFNLLPDQAEYQDLNRRLALIDTYAVARPQAKPGEKISHHTWPSWDAYSEQETRIDYLFLLKSALWDYRVTESRILFGQPVRGHLLSDHLGMASTIEVSRRKGLVPTFDEIKARTGAQD